MGGREKAKETADRLRAENAADEAKKEENRAIVKNQLAALQEDPQLAALYRENAKLGAENLGGSSPYLRIHTANSTKNELANGSRPIQGNYFYAPTREEFTEITCHILTVSRGFKILQKDEKTGEEKLQFNQLLAGVIVDKGEFKPFLMYINGLKCQPLWKFTKEAAEITRSGIPMFAMVVKMGTEEIKTDYGFKWVPTFEIVRSENGQLELISDVVTFNNLKLQVQKLSEDIESLIDAKASEDTTLETVATPIREEEELVEEPSLEDTY